MLQIFHRCFKGHLRQKLFTEALEIRQILILISISFGPPADVGFLRVILKRSVIPDTEDSVLTGCHHQRAIYNLIDSVIFILNIMLQMQMTAEMQPHIITGQKL